MCLVVRRSWLRSSCEQCPCTARLSRRRQYAVVARTSRQIVRIEDHRYRHTCRCSVGGRSEFCFNMILRDL
ncbi:MAG: hypothetical protein ACI8XZ_005494 [Gammaproteobacteria bacterium]|jgi:hypothetical protein